MVSLPPPVHAVPTPTTARAFSCACGRPVFFRNSQCLACQRALGYDATRGKLLALDPVPARAGKSSGTAGNTSSGTGGWREAGVPARRAPRYVRCANLDSAAACNWLLDAADVADGHTLCRCCRLTRTVPDLTQPDAGLWWCRIEQAKRRLVSSLLGLRLPVISKAEDAERGLAFDLLLPTPDGPPVITGHADGAITLDVSEADDARREERRGQLHEPYRTLLGHLRHETGHYYWQLLVEPSPIWLEPCRALFGDDRQDYAASLQRHYNEGPPADWGQHFVSAYASCHPWEDWAETWAHYLHLVDTLDTARSFGLDGERVELTYERFSASVIDASDPEGANFLQFINSWMELTGVLNELSRSMGVPDFYPFVLSAPAVRKLHLVHRVIHASGAVVPA